MTGISFSNQASMLWKQAAEPRQTTLRFPVNTSYRRGRFKTFRHCLRKVNDDLDKELVGQRRMKQNYISSKSLRMCWHIRGF